jgi:hypothetical protein
MTMETAAIVQNKVIRWAKTFAIGSLNELNNKKRIIAGGAIASELKSNRKTDQLPAKT